MRGRAIPLTIGRRIMQDLIAISGTPKPSGFRRMTLGPLVAAIKAARPPTTLAIVLAKAAALVAEDVPELRQLYVRLPWPHLFEAPVSVVSVIVKRDIDGEEVLLFARMHDPARMPLDMFTRSIRAFRRAPLESVKSFKTALRIARLPLLLRRPLWHLAHNIGRVRATKFGTIGISAVGETGVTPTSLVHPMTSVFSAGPVNAQGEADVILSFDHRVYDGRVAAVILQKLEAVLLGPMLTELAGLARHNSGPETPG